MSFIAESKAAALAHLDKMAAEQPHMVAGVSIVRPVVAAMPDKGPSGMGDLGVSVTSNGHVGDGSWSSAVINVTHLNFIRVSDPVPVE
jgi:hypothetical protein